jgi:uncharacterized protein (DUF488 family)
LDTPAVKSRTLYSIGHSTHPIETFLELLSVHGILRLIDVRSYPSSRRWPQFNQTSLEQSITQAGLEYGWIKALGGRRQSKRSDSPHTAWKVAAFRAYADYADGPEWAAGLAELIVLAESRRTAIMCAEGLWWQCHRRIIADHLAVRDTLAERERSELTSLRGASRFVVRHIQPDGKLADHALPEFASVRDGRLFYDGGQPPLGID